MLFSRYDFNPFFETFPLSEQNEKVVFANLIESFDFIEPFLYRYKFCGFRVDKFADAFTAKSVIILYFFVDDFRIGDYLHIIVIVLAFADHIDELICG